MTNVLVTGGAGYIGSHTCKALAGAGFVPVTYDNLSHGHREFVRWGPLVVGDVSDGAALRAALRAHRPVAVLHFAASAYVGESTIDPGKYYRNNVAGSLCLLEAVRDAGIPHMVFSSTCATYGVPSTDAISEDHPQSPVNPYGASKLMVERMLKDFGAAHGLRSISLRYFNAAGADESGEIGEWHEPETHLVPLVLDAAAGVRADVTIAGTDYPTPDGTCIRDYVHVQDLAAAHVLALRALQAGHEACALNLGNGNGFSVREVVAAAERVTARRVRVLEGPRRAGDPARLVGDASRARREIGWSPAQPDLDVILASAWAWHQRLRESKQ